MINLRNNKGITLMSQVITLVIFMIIISIITYSSNSSLQVKKLNNMYADILSIQEKAANYYLKYGEAPIDKSAPVSDADVPYAEKNPNDEDGAYYKVDISKLLNITLSNEETEENYYYMNEKTLTTYYTTGVTVHNLNSDESDTYHTLPSNYDGVTKMDITQFQTEN